MCRIQFGLDREHSPAVGVVASSVGERTRKPGVGVALMCPSFARMSASGCRCERSAVFVAAGKQGFGLGDGGDGRYLPASGEDR
jgi:hypothetical protein